MSYGEKLQERTMHNIIKIEEVPYQTGPGEPIIGFNLYYDDGVVYPIGPVLLRQELEAIRKDAYDRGYEQAIGVFARRTCQ